ncbi:neutral alpha-glucosidase C-like [Onthophagus taurus]|uniref:neutral alpha-glucosidase C-like n=1 Tax=Onthophagus taurus TaxID=166361 RepID=UPI0039BE9EDD
MNLAIQLLYLLICTTQIYGWYTCDDKTFCRNIRYKEFGESSFKLLADHATITHDSLFLDLVDTSRNKTFLLTVNCAFEQIHRFNIQDPEKRRFNPKESLQEFQFKENGNYIIANDRIITYCGPSTTTLYADPFRIEVHIYDTLIATANNDGKLVINTDDDDESISMDFEFMETERVYGIPLHAERLSLRNTGPGGTIPYRLYNVDHCCYAVDSQEPLYGSVPVLYAHGRRRTTGLFWLNSAQTFVDIQNNPDTTKTFFISESGEMDFYVLIGPTLEEATRQYTLLTGSANLPPQFSLGHHQSRYSYMSQYDLLSVVKNFDEHDFPVDVLWLDIDYTDNFKYFTWNFDAFPNPVEMQQTLNSTGRKLVVIIDPHIKVEEGYFVYDQGMENGYFVHNPDGSVFTGQCWPGLSTYIDFKNPHAQKWYSNLFDLDYFPSSTENMFIWNDMNEPVVFDQDEETMPNYLVHYDNWLHRDLHNMYGFLQTLGTWTGLMDRSLNTRRPFVLTRSHFAGSQRYAAIWTGDNLPTWEHLRVSFPMCLSEALAGISNCGADVGGFVGNVETELLQRWYQAGAWLPFFRQHSTKDSDRREPYLFPDDVQATIRKALRERYAHLQYWYTTFFEHELFGYPVIRPISYYYNNDINTLDIDDQWLVGKNILIHPVAEPQTSSINVYFPGGIETFWYSVEKNLMYFGVGNVQVETPIDYTPYFYRGGSIITRKNTLRRSSIDMQNDPYNIYVFLDNNNEAEGTLYVDDNISFDYKNNKSFLYYQLTYINGMLNMYTLDEDSHFEDKAFIESILVYRNPNQFEEGTKYIKLSTDNVLIKNNLNLKLKSGLQIKLL